MASESVPQTLEGFDDKHISDLKTYKRIVTKESDGAAVQKGQTVTVECSGYVHSTKKLFWSTKSKGQKQFSFQVGMGKVIGAWDAGVGESKVGEHVTIVASPEYGYGARGFPAWGIPPNAILVFKIEIVKAE